MIEYVTGRKVRKGDGRKKREKSQWGGGTFGYLGWEMISMMS